LTDADRALIVATARQFLGVRWRHAQSSKEAGVDCVGLFVALMRDLGIADYQPPNYGRQTTEAALRAEIEQFCAPIAMPERDDGDLLLFDILGSIQHVGMVTEGGWCVLHAVIGPDRVVEHRLDAGWRRRIRGVYRLKEELWNSRQRC
jgi:cell wall-associated NlpC family hydrolase